MRRGTEYLGLVLLVTSLAVGRGQTQIQGAGAQQPGIQQPGMSPPSAPVADAKQPEQQTGMDQAQNPVTSNHQLTVDDATLQRQIHEQFATRSELANVKVVVKNGVVYLGGSVPRQENLKQASDLAKSIPGVQAVNQNLTVNPNAGAGASSTTGAEKAGQTGITSGAPANSGTQGTSAQNPSNGGASGMATETTPNPQAGAAATGGNIATPAGQGTAREGSIPGARAGGVPSTQGDSISESDGLEGQIETALHDDPTLANDHLTATVNDTEIVLTGTVASTKEKETARRIGESFAMNRKVVDKITVAGHQDQGAPKP